MLKSYLKVALRTLRRHRGHAFLNVAGLALGMACCLLIFQYVSYETSFDGAHAKGDRIYRATFETTQNGESNGTNASVGYIFGPTVADEVPGVTRYVRIHPNYGDAVLSYQAQGVERTFAEDDVFFVDSTFLQVFDFPLVAGENALTKPHNMLLSSSAAERYFGAESPLGKTVRFTGWVEETYTVAGVFEDPPPTSHLQFEFLLPMQDLLADGRFERSPWGWQNFVTYLELAPAADAEAVEANVEAMYMKHRAEDFASSNTVAEAYLQPLADIHLNDEVDGPAAVTSSRKTVYFFTLIGLITLVIALVNYVNLATARAMDRAKEVGVRKAIGARKSQLVRQFLLESALTNMVALVLAVGLALAFLPVVNRLADVEMTWALWQDVRFWAVFLGVFGGGALLAGVYPAFVLSSFRPAAVLKGTAGTFTSRSALRKGLVVVQFAASIALLAGTAIVYSQLSYMRDLDTGFDLEQVLVVEQPLVRAEEGDRNAEMATLKSELQKLPAVRSVGLSTTTPGRGFMWYTYLHRATADATESQPVRGNWVDEGFAEVYGLKLAAGRTFHDGFVVPDSVATPIVVNEALVRAFGFESNEDALDAVITHNPDHPGYVVIGVMEDFQWSSAHQEAESVLMVYRNSGGNISMKVSGENLPATIAATEEAYRDLFPGNPFAYSFADAAFDEQYENEQRFAALFSAFAGIAVLIACLGLFGLAAYTAERRRKEISVRKVLGARVPNLVGLLTGEFAMLVGLAFVVAAPVAYVVMSRWLDAFAYRITLGPGLFLLAGAAALAIALLTVSYHAVRAATANPTSALRAD